MPRTQPAQALARYRRIQQRAQLVGEKQAATQQICAAQPREYSSRPAAFGWFSQKPGERHARSNIPRETAEARNGGNRPEAATPSGQIGEARITGQEFVAADTRQRDLETVSLRGLCDKPGVDPVDRGLIHRVENIRQIPLELAPFDAPDNVLGAITRRHLGGERRFVFAVPRNSSNCSVIARGFRVSGVTQQPEHGAQSTPADRKTPISTSARLCARTLSSPPARTLSASSGRVPAHGRHRRAPPRY